MYTRMNISDEINSVYVMRDAGRVVIPNNPDNIDWQAFEAWCAEGNEPADAPPLLPAVPAAISDRQFAQVLALDGVISKPEALAWAARGELPQKLKDALLQIPEAGASAPK